MTDSPFNPPADQGTTEVPHSHVALVLKRFLRALKGPRPRTIEWYSADGYYFFEVTFVGCAKVCIARLQIKNPLMPFVFTWRVLKAVAEVLIAVHSMAADSSEDVPSIMLQSIVDSTVNLN